MNDKEKEPTNVELLEKARKIIVKVYQKEVNNDFPDNGNLSVLNGAIISINTAVKNITGRQD